MTDAIKPGFFARAELLIQESRFELAEQELRRAIAQAPENGIAFGMLALCLAHQDKRQGAIECADRAISLAPNEAYVFSARAYVLNHLGQTSEASYSADQAIRLAPEEQAYWSLKAWISMTGGKWSEAYGESARAFELNPKDSVVASQHALTLIRMRQDDAAIKLIETALANDPEDACGHLVSGWYHVLAGDFDRARLHFREAIRLDPRSTYSRAGMLLSIKSRSRLFRLLMPSGFGLSPAKTMLFLLVTIFCCFGLVFNIRAMDERFNLGAGVVPPMVAVVCVAVYRQLLGPYSNAFVFLNGFGRPLLLQHQLQSMTVAISFLTIGIVFLVQSMFDRQFLPWIPAAGSSIVCGLVASDCFKPAGTLTRLVRIAIAIVMFLLLLTALVCQIAEHSASSRLWHALLATQCAYVLIRVFSFIVKVMRRVHQRKHFEQHAG